MSQFGIDITFQFDPDASTIAASLSLVSLVFSFFFSRQPPPVRHSLLLVRDAN